MLSNSRINWEWTVLGVIIALAAAVRLVGINWGFPYVYYPDESMIVNHAMKFGTGNLNPGSFIYPSLMMYILFLIYIFIYGIGTLIGIFSSQSDFINLFFTDATPFYLPGRLLSYFCGILSVYLVYRIGKRVFKDSTVGLLAALFLCFSVRQVWAAHFVKTYALAGVFILLTVNKSISILEGKSRRLDYFIAGALSGLAASTIYHAGFVLIVPLCAYLIVWYNTPERKFRTLFNGSGAYLAILGSALFFVLGTPFAVLDFPTFIGDLTASGKLFAGGTALRHSFFFPVTSLWSGIGNALSVVTIGGLFFALFKGSWFSNIM